MNESQNILDINDPKSIDLIWKRGLIVDGYDPQIVRKDCTGAWMVRGDYNDSNSIFGWMIDHIYPLYLGGDDNVLNLRPMQWKNCKNKGNDYPEYVAVIASSDNTNVEEERSCIVNKDLQVKLSKTFTNFVCFVFS